MSGLTNILIVGLVGIVLLAALAYDLSYWGFNEDFSIVIMPAPEDKPVFDTSIFDTSIFDTPVESSDEIQIVDTPVPTPGEDRVVEKLVMTFSDKILNDAPMPTPRFGLHVETINGTLYAVGGNDGSGDTPVVEAYNQETNEWSVLTPLPKLDSGNDGRYEGATGVIDNKLYLVGGWRISPPLPSNVLQIYDPETNEWSKGTDAPMFSACSAAGVIDRKLYVLTACDGYSGFRKRLDMYDPDTGNWTEKTPAQKVHANAVAGVIEDKFYVAGGGNGSNPTNILEVYNPKTDTWETKSPMSTVRSASAGGVINGKLYVVSGNDGNINLNNSEVYDPETDRWETLDEIFTTRSRMSATVINGVLYIVGGSVISGALDIVETFKP